MSRFYAWLRWRVILLLAAMTPPCRAITAQCSRKMDGWPTWNSWWQIPLHFAICDGCRRYLKQLEVLHHIASGYHPPSFSEDADSVRRKDRLRQRLRCERLPVDGH